MSEGLIGVNNISIIVQNESTGCIYQVLTHHIQSSPNYRKFWISWHDGFIKLGQGNNPKPILTKKNLVPDLCYVTFIPEYKANTIYWKCFMSPKILLLKPTIKKINGGKTHWEKFNGKLPEDAIIGGYENEILYIMREFHETALTPGKFVPSTGKGYVAWGDRAHEKNDFEIFCGFDCVWIPTSGDKIPVGAIEAGYTETGHEIMYVGRAKCDGHVIPGKIAPSHGVCYIAYDGKTVAIKDYDILVNPFDKNKSVNEFYNNLDFCDSTGHWY